MEMWGAAVSVAGGSVFQLLWMMMFFVLLSWRWLTSPLPGMAKGIWLQMCTLCGYGVFTHNYVCLCHGPTLTSPWCLLMCWLTACQHSVRAHMAGGWDIPARTLRAQTAPLSPAAVAFSPGAPARARRFTRILCRLPTCSCHAPTPRR